MQCLAAPQNVKRGFTLAVANGSFRFIVESTCSQCPPYHGRNVRHLLGARRAQAQHSGVARHSVGTQAGFRTKFARRSRRIKAGGGGGGRGGRGGGGGEGGRRGKRRSTCEIQARSTRAQHAPPCHGLHLVPLWLLCELDNAPGEQRRMLKFKPKLESVLSYCSFKHLVPGAFSTGFKPSQLAAPCRWRQSSSGRSPSRAGRPLCSGPS